MTISDNRSLKPYNTFGIDATTRYFFEPESEQDLLGFLRASETKYQPCFILGGGSNVLFTKDFEGTVIHIGIKGIEILKEDHESVIIKAGAGENWDDFVGFCVERGWGGLENMSLIPGNVGTTPVQNVGAYGVEVKDLIVEVEAIERTTGRKRIFTNKECQFSYRESIFKCSEKDRFIIVNVTFRLSKHPVLNLKYKGVKEELDLSGIKFPTLGDVRKVICDIRRNKLPDPSKIGNAGSFFKNLIVSPERLEFLKNKFPGIVSFTQGNVTKIPAAWLIEQCGWKGNRYGNAGVHADQPLVLVNHANATGKEILELANRIQRSVIEKFGIELEAEVTIE
jgi:UDP-N-acetylmuramate dehydrogenase